MANKLYEESSVQAIANAIRSKNGSATTYKIGDMASAILNIETQGETVPTYHYVEALEVAMKIEKFKEEHPNHLIFGAISDNHVYANNTTYETLSKASVLHGAFALETVGAMVGADFVANLGDNCWENGSDYNDNAYDGSLWTTNTTKPMHQRLTSFSLVGNHDKNDSTQTIYDLIGQYNDFDVWATTKIRSFGYKDFTDKKVRVICLNTCDYLNLSGGCALSYEQKDFLMRALDLSSKSNASSWQILLLSHIPLDWKGGDYNFYTDLQEILGGYDNGVMAKITVNSSYAKNETPSNYATYIDGTMRYDYTNVPYAKIIANIHGHVHTDKVGNIINTNIKRLATPNTCFYNGKSSSYPEYGDYSIDTVISRKENDVTDTSVTFYCVDLDEQEIYSYAFGAGNDRKVNYSGANMYTVNYNITSCTLSNSTKEIIEGASYSTTITPTDEDGTIKTVTVLMGGVDITTTCYSNGTITIDNVTGDISIVAVATVPLWTYTVTDIAVAIRSVWQVTSGTPSLANSNTEASIGVTTANSYSYTDRESKTVYLMPVNAKACDVTVENTDGISCTYRYIGLKDNNGTFATVFSTSKVDTNKHTWNVGSIDYILISMERKDGTSWAWGYDDTKVRVTFTNGGTEEPSEPSTPSYTNIIDTVGTQDNVRLRSGGATGSASGFASNYFEAKGGDVIRVYMPNGAVASIPSNGVYCCTYSNTSGTLVTAYDSSTSSTVLKNVTDKGYEIHIPSSVNCSYARVAGGANGQYADWVVTVNEEIS